MVKFYADHCLRQCRTAVQLYPPYNYSYAGHGHCDPPAREGEYYHVRCVGPERKLRPGQVWCDESSRTAGLLTSTYKA